MPIASPHVREPLEELERLDRLDHDGRRDAAPGQPGRGEVEPAEVRERQDDSGTGRDRLLDVLPAVGVEARLDRLTCVAR